MSMSINTNYVQVPALFANVWGELVVHVRKGSWCLKNNHGLLVVAKFWLLFLFFATATLLLHGLKPELPQFCF